MKGGKTNEELAQSSGCWVDVRDVAMAHTNAIKVEKAGGRRFIVSAGEFTMQDARTLSKLPFNIFNHANLTRLS